MKKNIIGITMGCPAGIGPEIILKLSSENKSMNKHIIVIGDLQFLKTVNSKLGYSLEFNSISDKNNITKNNLSDEKLNVFDLKNLLDKKIVISEPSMDAGKASVDYIESAVELCLENIIDAMVTCPINKDAIKKAGSPFPGHTQMIAHLTKTKNYGMMLAGSYLRVLLVTTHIALNNVSKTLNKQKVLDKIILAHTSLEKDFSIKQPRIAVTGLNPHNGENGMFGNEEFDIILPAVEQAKKMNINVEGPFPSDSLFPKVQNNFDVVVCMYHDQALIPLKLLSFGVGVNITLGLPIVRTSVDHGTGYDIVYKNKATSGSLFHAINTAQIIVNSRL